MTDFGKKKKMKTRNDIETCLRLAGGKSSGTVRCIVHAEQKAGGGEQLCLTFLCIILDIASMEVRVQMPLHNQVTSWPHISCNTCF